MNSGVQLRDNSLKLVKRVEFWAPVFFDWLLFFLFLILQEITKLTKTIFKLMQFFSKILLTDISDSILRLCKTGNKEHEHERRREEEYSRQEPLTCSQYEGAVIQSNLAKQIIKESVTRMEPSKNIHDLLGIGLGWTFQKHLCQNWKEGNLWCMTKYKPVGKKV